jgi:pimeloyl-ACP methyl ester carboxylesterase
MKRALCPQNPGAPLPKRDRKRWLGCTLIAGSLGAFGTPLTSAAPFASPRIAHVTTANVLPRGVVSRQQLRAGHTHGDYLLYVPASARAGAPILVSVHGISRNAREHLEMFAPLADLYGVVLLAPEFTKARFPGYQRLVPDGNGVRPDQLLLDILADAAALTGADHETPRLFGYSGGGQFVHRFVMAHPDRVAGYVVGAAGWYTFPDATLRFPLGLKKNRSLNIGGFDPDAFLTIPGAVLVGDRDNQSGSALRESGQISDLQGESRLERGKKWVEAMRHAAQERGMVPCVTFESLPESPHSFASSMRRGSMGDRVFAHLFGEEPAPCETGQNCPSPTSPSPAITPKCIVPA